MLGGRDVGRSFELEAGAVFGRAVDCAGRLGDRSISRHHARLVRTEDGWAVEDLDSRNGLSAGGRRVPRVEVGDGTEFSLGNVELRVRLGSEVTEFAPSDPGPRPAHDPAPDPAPPAEEEIHLEAEDPSATLLAQPPPARRPALEPTSAPAAELTERDRRRVELLRQPPGLLGGDLAQRPVWVRVVLVALILAAAAGMLFLAFHGVRMLRGGA